MADFDGFLVSLPAPSFSDAETHAPIVDGAFQTSKPFSSSASAFFLPEEPVTNTGHILDADTLALWRLDEDPGQGDYANIRDISGNGYDLPITGTISIVGGPDGVGLAKRFLNDQANYPNDATLDALFVGEWSYEGWLYHNDNTSDYVFAYGGSGESLATNYLASLVISGTGIVSMFMETGAGGTNITITSTAVVPQGVWTHLAVTKEDVGGSFDYHFYVNGAFVDTVNGAGSTGGGGQTFKLGISSGNAQPWDGGFGSMRWSDGVRSLGEIAASYARPGKDHAVDANTVINLPMDEQPDLFDEANRAHLRLVSGADEPAKSLIGDEGKSRTIIGTVYNSVSLWPPVTDAILAAIHDEFTLEFWGRLGTSWKALVLRGAWVWGNPGTDSGGDTQNFLSFDVLDTRQGRVFSEHGAGVNDVWDTTELLLTEDDQWEIHHYAITLVASGGFTTYEVYIDGALVATSDGTDVTHDGGSAGYVQLGQGQSDSNPWLGQLDDMRISNKKRSAEEILESYRAGRLFTIYGGPYWRMRGYDSDLGYPVYWEATSVDTLGAEYPGNSGALSDVVVSEVIGLP